MAGDDERNDSKTMPMQAVQGPTVELDRYAILSRVQQDIQQSNADTVQIPKPKVAREDSPTDPDIRQTGVDDTRPTEKLPAIKDATVLAAADPKARQVYVEEQTKFKTMPIVLEPVDPSPHEAATTPMSTRMTFEAVVQADGSIHLPQSLFKSGRVRPGMKLRVVADPA